MVAKISVAAITGNDCFSQEVSSHQIGLSTLLNAEIPITCLVDMVTKVSLATAKGTDCLGEDASP